MRTNLAAPLLISACATVVGPASGARSAPEAAVALARLLAPLAEPANTVDLVGSGAWPGAHLREDGGVVQVDFGRSAEARCGFTGRFTLTRQSDGTWLVSIDELSDGTRRYWGTAEVEPDSQGLTLRLDLVVLEGTRGAELVVSGRIRRVEGQWRIEAIGTWNDGLRKHPVRVARNLAAQPRITSPPPTPPGGDAAADKSLL